MGSFDNILVVDDQSAIRFIVKTMLTQMGHTVHLAQTGEEALRTISSRSDIDLMISDIHMEPMNGLEVLRACADICPNLPVVLMSARAKDHLIIEALRLGAVDYLVKPFDKVDLRSLLERIDQADTKPIQRIKDVDLVSQVLMNFTLTSGELSVRRLQNVVKKTLLLYMKISSNDLLNISLALEEAILNAHEHGNLELVSKWKEEYVGNESITRFEQVKAKRLEMAEYAGRKLNVTVKITPDAVTLSVEDGGKGYPAGIIGEGSDIKPYGMGLMLINNLMDSISFNETGTTITFQKRIPQAK